MEAGIAWLTVRYIQRQKKERREKKEEEETPSQSAHPVPKESHRKEHKSSPSIIDLFFMGTVAFA